MSWRKRVVEPRGVGSVAQYPFRDYKIRRSVDQIYAIKDNLALLLSRGSPVYKDVSLLLDSVIGQLVEADKYAKADEGLPKSFVSTILRSQRQGNILAWAFGITSIILAYPQVTAMISGRPAPLPSQPPLISHPCYDPGLGKERVPVSGQGEDDGAVAGNPHENAAQPARSPRSDSPSRKMGHGSAKLPVDSAVIASEVAPNDGSPRPSVEASPSDNQEVNPIEAESRDSGLVQSDTSRATQLDGDAPDRSLKVVAPRVKLSGRIRCRNLHRAVELELVVGVDGRVKDVRSSGQSIIPPEIMNSVRGIEFAPGTVDGIATEMISTLKLPC